MTDFPLLPLPTPESDDRPAGPRGGGRPTVPTRQRQGERLQPTFQRVQDVFDRGDDPLTLLADPSAIAPERALVFEVAGNVDALGRAVSNLPGLEYLGDEALEFEPDEDFAEADTRQGREGQPRRDRPVRGRLYLTMPDTRALQRLLSLWNRHQRGQDPGRGNRPWFDLFDQLHRLRAWGPEDRLPDDTVAYLNERLEDGSDDVRLEVELWWRGNTRRVQSRFVEAVQAADGRIVDQASIPEIGYRAALVDVPATEVRRLAAREEVALAVCDDIMLIRPQSTAAFPTDAEETDAGRAVEQPAMPEGPPIVAVFDGVPVLAHQLLDRRIEFDDPDDLAAQSVVSERLHGTEMASLVIHGDRNLQEMPLTRPIYVRPVLYAPGSGRDETTQPDRLLVDTIYRAVLRMREGDAGEPPQAPDVFIVNLSLGDPRRPFAGPMSPWGRLLDHLAARYGLLFIVSAGNIINTNLPVPAFQGITDFEAADPTDRQQAILEALGGQRSQRTLLSPAEALNPITVGAWHEDAMESQPSSLIYRPYVDDGPNITSAMGLGHNRVVKPDIFMAGGKEHLLPARSGGGLVVRAAQSGRIHGLKAAMPDEVGRLDREGLTAGTSAATALATRSAHRLFDALMDEDNGGVLQDADRRYYGVVVKALLVHRARWGEVGAELEDIYGPKGRGTHIARRDNIARVLGYGRPNVEEALACAANRATLVGYGEVAADGTASLFRVPLPSSLKRVTEPRTITLTLAWFSPVNIRHRAYRRAKLEITPNDFKTSAGVERSPNQPSDKPVPRGSLFHVRYEGHRAVPFVDDGHLSFRVFCREQGGPLDEQISYGIAVTVEAGEHVPIYQEVRQRLGVQARGAN